MRVLTAGRAALVPALVAGGLALALPAFAGTPAHAGAPGKDSVRTFVHPGGSLVGARNGRTSVAVLGPAVKYVREADGTTRRMR